MNVVSRSFLENVLAQLDSEDEVSRVLDFVVRRGRREKSDERDFVHLLTDWV